MNSAYSVLENIEIQIIQNVVITRYFTAAALVLVMYDAMLTMDDEVRLVWRRPFSVPTLLYYINRYWTIASLITASYLIAGFRPPLSTTFCRYWTFVGGIAELIAVIPSSAFLILRVAALYDSKWLRRAMWTLSVLIYIIAIASAVIILNGFYKNFVYEPLSGVCITLDGSLTLYRPFAIIFSLPIIFDAALLILTVLKIFRLATATRKLSGSEILHTMFRDGVIYFFVVVALRILNTIIWMVLPSSFMYLGLYSYWSMLSTMTSRLFLNLRSAGSSTSNLTQTQSVSAIPLGNRRVAPPEYTQASCNRTVTAGNLDSTLFEMVSGVNRSASSGQEQILSWDGAGTKPSEDFDIESQPRVG